MKTIIKTDKFNELYPQKISTGLVKGHALMQKGCGLNPQPLLATQDASGTVRLNVVMP